MTINEKKIKSKIIYNEIMKDKEIQKSRKKKKARKIQKIRDRIRKKMK